MEQMSLVVFRDTGHVLAAVTRAAGEDDLSVEELVGAGLPLRHPQTGLPLMRIDADDLEVRSADRDDAVLAAPLSAHEEDGTVTLLPRLEDPVASSTPIDLDGATLELTLPAMTTLAVEARVLVQPAGQPQQDRTVPIAAASTNGSIPMGLANGSYGVLVLIPGYGAFFGEEDVP